MQVENKVVVTMSHNEALELIRELADGLVANQTNPVVIGDLQIWLTQHDDEDDESYLCQCDCGNQTVVRGEDLTSGRVTSCGECEDSGVNKRNPFWRAAR